MPAAMVKFLFSLPGTISIESPVKNSYHFPVRLKLPEKEALVVVDGQTSHTISAHDKVLISKAKKPARFVKVEKDGFYAKVKSKLT